ncbi:hypothetical protein URH17368_1855 [Alicyclobacillus hesperidum URH17-3-68]|nr:hypothetical protein URH17368_1855 [Alicyclobacillus hesperidum URH17-3-68]
MLRVRPFYDFDLLAIHPLIAAVYPNGWDAQVLCLVSKTPP